jgi:hypothetical protein
MFAKARLKKRKEERKVKAVEKDMTVQRNKRERESERNKEPERSQRTNPVRDRYDEWRRFRRTKKKRARDRVDTSAPWQWPLQKAVTTGQEPRVALGLTAKLPAVHS